MFVGCVDYLWVLTQKKWTQGRIACFQLEIERNRFFFVILCSENIILPRINDLEGDLNDLEETKLKKKSCVFYQLFELFDVTEIEDQTPD